MEDVDATYGPLWRSYVFEHNDLGYPLLKEKLSSIQYVWDCTPYYQPGGRLWSTCIKEHPTAIEAVSYWIGKTVPYPAVGDRPGLPSIIAHEHNGWCGELQQIAVAAQRAALIPSIGACNVGEDHVWREFFERGWHENDNWWSDTGGAVDEPDVYAYGWGKNMSAIYAWRGDDTIIDDTARYIHPQDRITVTFNVYDAFFQPIDGARVTVLVKGPKDITYYKNLIWEKLQAIWDKLPEFLKGKPIQFLFEKFKERYDKIPGEVNGVTITTWNYTDLNGRCSFQLGKNREYLFLIQEGNLKKPWQLARHNTFRSLKTHSDKTFQVIVPDISHKEQRSTKREMPSGDLQFDLSYTTTAHQLQQNFFTNGIGSQELIGSIECFFVDQQNFEKYTAGKPFTCFNYLENEQANVSVSAVKQDWYLIFRNHARLTQVVVDFSVDAVASTEMDRVQIVTPDTSLFETPMYNIGDTVLLSGVATDTVYLVSHSGNFTIALQINTINGEWSYPWTTSTRTPGTYTFHIDCGDASDERSITLIDAIPPKVSLSGPSDGAIVKDTIVLISGQSSDNVGVDHVDVAVDGEWRKANGTTSWNLTWDVSGLMLGDHTLSAKAVDAQGLLSMQTISFVLNEGGHTWGPRINLFYHLPTNLTNASNVIVYANVTLTSPYALKTITLFWDNGINITSCAMYRYGEYPVQSRHEEDPLRNQSNAPIFGVELGQFSTGQTITYWIVASDTAHNTIQSDEQSFTVGS